VLIAVYADGGICLDILQNQWSPIYDVSAILTSIQVTFFYHADVIKGLSLLLVCGNVPTQFQDVVHSHFDVCSRSCVIQIPTLQPIPRLQNFTVKTGEPS